MLLWVYTITVQPCVPLFLFLPQFDIICDLLLNRHMATWNLFVNSLHRRCFVIDNKKKMLIKSKGYDFTN